MSYRDLSNVLMRAKLQMAMLFQRFKTFQNYDSHSEIYAFENIDFHFENIRSHFFMLMGMCLSFEALCLFILFVMP
jgi:hypothetical protein